MGLQALPLHRAARAQSLRSPRRKPKLPARAAHRLKLCGEISNGKGTAGSLAGRFEVRR